MLVEHKIFGKSFFTRGQVERGMRWFSKYGSVVVFFSRLIPGFRTLVSFPAGAVRMPLMKFVAYTTVGCLIWNAVLIYVGVILGQNWSQVAGVSHYLIIVAAVVLVALVAAFLVMRKKRLQASVAESKNI